MRTCAHKKGSRNIMSIVKNYHRALSEDLEYFKGAKEIYRNDFIVLMDARPCLPPMKKEWKRRSEDLIRGLVLHHKASWNGYERMQSYVESHKCKPANPEGREQNRIAYTMGVHHNALTITDEDKRELVPVFLFNDFTAKSYHSGSRGADTEYFKGFTKKWGSKSVNKNTVGLNFVGFFSSERYPYNIPGTDNPEAAARNLSDTLILHPSTLQFRAAFGVYMMCQEKFPNFDPEAVFGHKDTGKSACPGDLGYMFAEALREGRISTTPELEHWLTVRPATKPQFPTLPNVPQVREYQWFLVQLGYDLGPYGPKKDGVDGCWGRKSEIALLDFEEEHALLENGTPDLCDYEELFKVYWDKYQKPPVFT